MRVQHLSLGGNAHVRRSRQKGGRPEERPESREETPKEGIRRQVVARLKYIAPHKMQWAKAPIGGKSAAADRVGGGVIFLHHIGDAH